MIAVLHPGEMGTAVGRALLAGGHEVGWLRAGRSPATARRAEEAGFVALDTLDDVEIVISLCPPDAALATAQSVGGFAGLYVDANATSPARAREIAAQVREFVDASVIGPPPQRAGTSRLYLAGVRAREVAALFEGSALAAVVLEQTFAASALKMSYAAWTKISSALLLSAHESARRAGVGDALAQEWAWSQPELARRHERAQASAQAKGWRWSGEMREIADTFADLGLPAGFGRAAAEVYEAFDRPT